MQMFLPGIAWNEWTITNIRNSYEEVQYAFSKNSNVTTCFFLKDFNLFLERGGGRENERERNIK